MLRIDPALALVWRTPTCVQVGVPDPVVVAELTPAQEHLLVALRAGVSAVALDAIGRMQGLTAAEVAAFVDAFDACLERPAPPRLRVGIDGVGATAEWIGHLLGSFCEVRAVVSAPPSWKPDLVVVLGAFAIAPARAGAWLSRDVPHLAVVLADRSVRVGPLVLPGRTACVTCGELARADADPSWRGILAQLHGKPAGVESALVAVEVATVVTRWVQEFVRGVGATGEVLMLDATTGLWTSDVTSPWPKCSCLALPENGMADAA